MRRAVAIGVLTAVLVGTVGVSPAFACGCGGVVSPVDTTVSVSHERAILHWADGRETIELMVDMDSDSDMAGIIVPTPSAAKVSTGDARTFELIENTIVPSERIETDVWGVGYLMPEAVPITADSFNRVQVGPLEVTTMAASDTASMETWLAANQFVLSPELATSLATYAELGWSLTAVKLTNDKGLDGHIDPIQLSFETERLVYPMQLAQTETTPQSVRLYVFDKQRTGVSKATSPTVDIDGTVTVAWSGAPEDRRLLALGAYLTVFDIRYDDPPTQARSDIGIVYSLSDKDVRPETVHYRMITLLGFPVGTLIVLWTTLGLTLALGHVVGRRRAR
jgi:hypothetical protein